MNGLSEFLTDLTELIKKHELDEISPEQARQIAATFRALGELYLQYAKQLNAQPRICNCPVCAEQELPS